MLKRVWIPGPLYHLIPYAAIFAGGCGLTASSAVAVVLGVATISYGIVIIVIRIGACYG